MSKDFFGKDKTISDITTYQVGALESAAHRSLRQYKDNLLKPYDLSGMDWYIIGAVADAGTSGIRTTDLALHIGTTLGFMTKQLKLLEAKKIVHRKANAQDARSSFVFLNPAYRKKILQIEQMLRDELRDKVYALVTKDELETYIRVMEKFSRL